MPFELTHKTPAILVSVTPRTEKHGDRDIPAVTLGLRITAANTMLDLLQAGFMAAIYKPVEDPPEQGEIEGTEVSAMPLLRVRCIETIAVKGELNGWALAIEYGIDESSAIHLGACKVDKLRVKPAEGGSIELSLRIGTSDVDEESMGRLTMLLGHEINITLIAPVRTEQQVIDGTGAEFKRDHPEAQGDLLQGGEDGREAGDAFADAVQSDRHAGDFGQADGEGGPGAGDSDDTAGASGGDGGADGAEARGDNWPFTIGNDGAADAAAEFEAGASAALAAAGVKPKGRGKGTRKTAPD